MKHEVVREISTKNRHALCVVVGVITTTKPCKITATLTFKVDGDAKVGLLFTHIRVCLGEWEQIKWYQVSALSEGKCFRK